jgi:hypothetical protein
MKKNAIACRWPALQITMVIALLLSCAFLNNCATNNSGDDLTTRPANQRPYKSVLDWDTSPPG